MRIAMFERGSFGGKLGLIRSVVAVLSVATLALAGCSAGETGGASSSETETIKIGYVHPKTGAYAGFSDGDDYMLKKVREYFADGLEVGGITYPVEILDRDSGSDPAKAGELASQLITQDGVDLMLATSTPETTNPVIAQCEANAVPCITTVAPWQAVVFGGGFGPDNLMKWSHHFYFGIEAFGDVEPNAWDQVDTNKVVGVLWPNDADGGAFRDPVHGYPPFAEAYGYTIVDPGAYENGTQDFTSIINTFKKNNVEIITGVPIPPDFVNFWTQAAQQGFKPKVVTVAKALFFPATVPSIPNDLGEGLAFVSSWGPTFPYKSSFDGTTPSKWIADFEASPEGKELTGNQVTASNYALFELAVAGLQGAGDPFDKAAVNAALDRVNIMTLSGQVDFTAGPFPGIATVSTVVGQWEKTTDGGWQWVVVDNTKAPHVPIDRAITSLR